MGTLEPEEEAPLELAVAVSFPDKIAETNDERLDASAELVTDVTGTKVELSIEMLEITVGETEATLLVLEAWAALELGDTKLKVDAAVEVAFGVVAPGTMLVLYKDHQRPERLRV